MRILSLLNREPAKKPEMLGLKDKGLKMKAGTGRGCTSCENTMKVSQAGVCVSERKSFIKNK